MGIGIESGRIHLDPGTYQQGHLQWVTDLSNIQQELGIKDIFISFVFNKQKYLLNIF